MGNYCHSGETKQEEDNASQKSFTKTSTNVLPEPCNSENHDQSNTQDKFQINTTCSKQFTTENSLEKSEFQMLSKHSIESLSTYPTSLNILYGHQQVISKIKKQPKIVLYIISPLSGHSKEKDVLLDVYHQICNKYQSSEFEIFFCDLHYEINKFINNLHVPHSWGLEGHIQAVNCLSAISKYMNNCYLIPILLLSDFVGDLLLPLTFEIQDFLNLTKSISEKDIKHKELIEKWYKLDLNSKPECYRLELKSKIPVDEERKILDILIEVLSVELLDLYLTTILEQEVNQTILFNQDVAKRCLWIQNTSDSPKILDKELLRRISNLKQEVSRHLTDDQIFETTLHTAIDKKNMEISVKTSLCNIIEYIMDDYNCRFKIPNCTNGVDRKLLLELDNNDRYIKHLVQNRSNFRILQNIKSHLFEQLVTF
uniref:CSON000239 protein n=1 Tax=Culicoides sonorensis TaxID=179676 RepID=A0A336MI88_CULSO